MACILLPDMDSPTVSPTPPHNDVLPAHELASTLEPKQDPSATCLTVHLYHQVKDGAGGGAKGSESTLTFPAGQYVAEELCISAAKACGEFQEFYFFFFFFYRPSVCCLQAEYECSTLNCSCASAFIRSTKTFNSVTLLPSLECSPGRLVPVILHSSQ